MNPPLTAVEVTRETATTCLVDGGGQTTLLLGPGVLDVATAKARRAGHGAVSVTTVRDVAWLGQLAARAAARRLVCLITFSADPQARERADLAALYSTGRSILALPEAAGPLWVEAAFAPASHDRLMAGDPVDDPAALARDALVRDALAPGRGKAPGFTLVCLVLAPAAIRKLRGEIMNHVRNKEIQIFEPEQISEPWRRAIADGLEVDDPTWYALASYGLTNVVPSSEDSRRQAGAES